MKHLSLTVFVLLLTAYVFGPVSHGVGAEPGRAKSQKGWRVLLDGKNLDAWQDGSGGAPPPNWVIENDAVVRKERGGNLWTKDRFGDFLLDLEFKTEGNSGVFIRTDDPKNCVQTGIEIQVNRPADSPSKGSCGAIYNCVAPSKEMCKADQWNHLVIRARDNRLAVTMNGEKIATMNLNRWTEPRKNPDGTPNKFHTALKDFSREGHIGLQDHGAVVAYRNVRIKPLKKANR